MRSHTADDRGPAPAQDFMEKAAAPSPQLAANIGGLRLNCLVDTGAQVSTIREEAWIQMKSSRPLQQAPAYFKMSAANGTNIPYKGFIVCDVQIGEQSVKDAIFFVVPKSCNPVCQVILGMNCLRHLPGYQSPPSSKKTTGIAKTLGSPVAVPPQSTKFVEVSGPDLQTKTNVVVESCKMTPSGLVVMNSLSISTRGVTTVAVTNLTNETISIPARSPIGLISTAQPCMVNLVGVDEGEDSDMEVRINNMCGDQNLTPDQRQKLREFINQNADSFAWDDDKLGYTELLPHRITLTTDRPVAQPYRRIPPTQLQEVREHLDDLLKKDIIRPSTSPYAAPIVIVRKKNGKIRCCCDYRRLNDVTVKDAFPLPRMDECIDALAGAK